MGVACGLFHAWFIICIEWKFLAVVAEWVFAPYLGLEGEVPGGPLACYACTPSSCKRSAGESRSGGAHHGQVVGGIGMNGKVMAWCAFPLAPPPLAMLASVAHRGAAEGLGRPACCSGDTPPSRRFLALFVYLCETFGGVHACPP
jgi:hypothetical protein